MRNVKERLQDLIDDIRRNKIKACELISEEGKYNLANDIETVLNMLKENSAEIEQKNIELAEKNAEIERLKRQMDLMAEEIEKGDIEFTEYCNFKIVCDRNCKDCIERYFERKATNNG